MAVSSWHIVKCAKVTLKCLAVWVCARCHSASQFYTSGSVIIRLMPSALIRKAKSLRNLRNLALITQPLSGTYSRHGTLGHFFFF